MTRDGLLIDFGGVLTTNVFESFAAFCRAEGLDPDTVRDRFMQDRAARNLLGELEEGRISNPEFEARFGPMLGVDATPQLSRQVLPVRTPESERQRAVEKSLQHGLGRRGRSQRADDRRRQPCQSNSWQ